MKRLIYIFLILLGFTSSCVRNDRVSVEDPEDIDGKVDLVFGVKLPEQPSTKAMAEDPDISNLYVAVFGGSGFLKEYVQADPVQLATANGVDYTYTVRLSLTDSHVKVHFIANGPATIPFRYEDEVMSALSTAYPQDAYWQKIELENGITAKKDTDGKYIKVNGEYQVTDETKGYFQHIPLIRNFAKIEVMTNTQCENEDFHLISYAVVNKPLKGSIAPYNPSSGSFVTNYQSKTYDQLCASYPGNIPADATMDTDIPDPSDFANAPFYMYERPEPTDDNPTYILIYGTYKRSDPQKNCYYRLELMDEDGYYTIYRNFNYQVVITGIKREGSDTPEDAVNTAGSGDVSTDATAKNLSDISDGRARLYVEYMEKTIVGGGDSVKLKYCFIPDVQNHPTTSSNGSDVLITVGEPGATGEVIYEGRVKKYSADETDGWRTLAFKATTASASTKSQTIKITGNYTFQGSSHRLFRDVTFKLLETQVLSVVCSPDDQEHGSNKAVDVLIKIPRDLPRSIFPINFKIEVEKLSLSPLNDNLPVYPGKSLIDNTTNTYYFIKELSYDDYITLQTAQANAADQKVTVTTHFKTTKDASDTKVYVTADYFNQSYGEYTTYTIKQFSGYEFSNYVQTVPNSPITFSFDMDGTDVPDKVILTLTGLKPNTNSGLVQIGTSNQYEWYNPGQASSASISLLTSNDGGYYKVELSANHYQNGAWDNTLSYPTHSFNPSSGTVGAGAGQQVRFDFSYASPTINNVSTPQIQPVTFTLVGLRPRSTDTQFQDLGGGKWLYTPTNNTAAQTVYFETTAWYATVSVSMDGDSYYAAGPYTKNSVASVNINQGALRFSGLSANTAISVYKSTSPDRVQSFTTSRTNGNPRVYYNPQFTMTQNNYADSDMVYFTYGTGTNIRYSTEAYSIATLASKSNTNYITINWQTTPPTF